ncbi:MAG: hypothetical protein QM778_10425 [Myxococcales bacterium]
MSELHSKPAAPWRSEGSGLAIPCIVSARNVSVPDEFRVLQTAGHTLGMLLYLEFVGSDAVTRRELLWLSAIVRSSDPAYDDVPRMGPMYFVARSYSDHVQSSTEDSGVMERRDWHLPKGFAHFARRGNRIEIDAEDGTQLAFSWTPRGLTFPSPTTIASLQNTAGRVLCFQAQGKARAQLATYRLESFHSDHPDWQSFASGLVLPGVASHLKSFNTALRAPLALPRRLDSIAPTPSLVRVARAGI